MTCIVGIRHEGGVVIGADSAGVSGFDLQTRRDGKLVRLGTDFLMGFTSSFRMGQLLAFKLSPSPIHADVDPWRYMVETFVEDVRKCLTDGGFSRKDNNVESGGVFLVGFRGRLFKVEGDFQVGETVDGFDAVGCGSSYALGSLAETEDLPPTERVARALRIAERFSAGVRAPFQVENLPAPEVG